jgi:hypothetical protein
MADGDIVGEEQRDVLQKQGARPFEWGERQIFLKHDSGFLFQGALQHCLKCGFGFGVFGR